MGDDECLRRYVDEAGPTAGLLSARMASSRGSTQSQSIDHMGVEQLVSLVRPTKTFGFSHYPFDRAAGLSFFIGSLLLLFIVVHHLNIGPCWTLGI
jgi:hypothetical protein